MEDITQFTDVAPLIRKTGILALPRGPIAALRSLRPVYASSYEKIASNAADT